MTNLDTMRAEALLRIDRAERSFKAGIIGAALFEVFFTVALALLVDVRNELHQVILLCTGLIFMPLLFGLMALGSHVNRCTLRVLQRLDEEDRLPAADDSRESEG